MAELQDVRNLVLEYSKNYRKESLAEIIEGKKYSLLDNKNGPGWPDRWINCNERGVYAVFSGDKLLRIGKASHQGMGFRLSSYFRYGEEKQCVTTPGQKWTKTPTSVSTWAVPKDMPFEASALEEFLIGRLGDELPDNAVGKNS